MRNYIKLLIITFLCYIGDVYAHTSNIPSRFSNIVLKGVIADSSIISMPNSETDVTVIISKYPLSAANIVGVDYRRYELKAKYNKFFKLKIPSPSKRFYMYIYYLPGLRTLSWSSFDNVYILDEGDNVTMHLGKNEFTFFGKGSAKLNCESEIYKRKYDYSQEILQANSTDLKKYFDEINRKMDSCLLLQIAIVEKYKLQLGKEMSAILLANCYGLRYYEPLRGYRQLSDGNSNLYSAVISNNAYKNINFSLNSKVDPAILVQSPVYVDFIFEKIRMDNFLQKDGVLQLPISIGKSFRDIKQNYDGIIRAKLLALFFINYSSIPSSLDYLEEAISLSKPSIYRNILLNIQRTKSKGLPFYPFELQDAKGGIIKLSDLNNKVVILDFWYTGCINCINLKNAMKEIHQLYKENPKVAFVSISIDKDKQKWLKSVASGVYCDPEDINLFTGGLADKHPVITQYAIQGYPRTFILKSGKIFNSDPPYPVRGSKQLINIIEEAILVQ